jgi:hypothetical protein
MHHMVHHVMQVMMAMVVMPVVAMMMVVMMMVMPVVVMTMDHLAMRESGGRHSKGDRQRGRGDNNLLHFVEFPIYPQNRGSRANCRSEPESSMNIRLNSLRRRAPPLFSNFS